MPVIDELRAALAFDNRPGGLRLAAEHALHSGAPREQVIAELDRLLADMGKLGRQSDEDVVLDVIDFVTGWCSPQVRL